MNSHSTHFMTATYTDGETLELLAPSYDAGIRAAMQYGSLESIGITCPNCLAEQEQAWGLA